MDAIWSFFKDDYPEPTPSNEDAFAPAPKRAKISHDTNGVSHEHAEPTGQLAAAPQVPVSLPSFPLMPSSGSTAVADPIYSSLLLAESPSASTISNRILPMPTAQSSFASERKKLLAEKQEARRKSNAAHARKARERKKNMEASLQLELCALQGENNRLKTLVKSQIPNHAQEIIEECCYKPKGHSLFQGDLFHGDDQQSSKLVQSDFELIESLTKTKQSFVLTDPRRADNPIVYASCAFLKLTGYTREQVVGRNCRFLQGIKTDHKSVGAIREAIETGGDGAACLLNYKADGTPFWNQFFIAALRDKENNIVNFVGVQSEVASPNDAVQARQPLKSKTPTFGGPKVEKIQSVLPNDMPNEKPAALSDMKPHAESVFDNADDDLDVLDWSQLAEILEAGYQDEPVGGMEGMSIASGASGVSGQSFDEETVMQDFVDCPRPFITRTVRCEVIEALLACDGDPGDRRFTHALDILSNIFKSTVRTNASLSPILNGEWKTISRPSYHYGGCLGCNERGDFVYTLGKMGFNMFNPVNLRVTVQNTMSKIEPVCRMDKAPNAAPWSLRRELAMQDPESLQIQPNTTLKSYDIVAAVTIEPGQFLADKNEVIPSPPRRLRALQVANGYFLPDPNTPNRLTVWFTGGKLSPAGPPETDADEYGTMNDWFALFGADHKRTWGESFSVMGAKLLFGAELPQGMEADGSMAYMLHRPYGGHGKGYVDILYVDGELLIVKGNSGTLHVMINQGSST